MLSRIPKLVILTEAAKDEIKSLNAKVRDEQIVVIPDLLMVDKDSDEHSSLKNGNVSFVGRLSHEKGVMRLLRIWKRVSSELQDLTLSIYGDGDARGEMERYISDHQLKNVIFHGFCNDHEQIYKTSDLLLMTSDTEGFGMVLIEAMYYGVPCISFDCPISPKEIIADAGIVVPCFDEYKYAKTVVSSLLSDEYMHRLQQKSIIRARQFYHSTVVAMWLNIFN
jgi:glycosyltransferase involved in cell wall biosynthesis